MTKNNHLDSPQVEAMSEILGRTGFNLVSVLNVGDLPSGIVSRLPDFGHLSLQEQSLLLVANGGPTMWDALTGSADAGPSAEIDDPVDSFAVAQVTACLDTVVPEVERVLLYPDSSIAKAGAFSPIAASGHVPLQTLGSLAGWHQGSPMGIGIHPVHGLWFAYRALVMLDIELAPKPAAAAPVSAVCEGCQNRECVTHCPAGAVTFGQMPDMTACANHRLSENSVCRTQCLARNACPVGDTSRYHSAQIEYHYSLSLESLKRRLTNAS